jgi:nitroreductase
MSLVPPSPELYERVRGLRVVRAYTPDPISEDDMTAILEVARWTGSSKNVQGWEFVVVTGEQLATLASAGRFTDPVRNSAATIALVETPAGNGFDIGRAAQNIMLAAAARGIGSCPITLHDGDRAAEVLALPDGYGCRYAISLGHPLQDDEERLRQARRDAGVGGRKPLPDLVHRQRFGSG